MLHATQCSPPRARSWALVVLLVWAGLFSEVVAQPPEGSSLQGTLPLENLKNPLHCPDGYCQTADAIYGCSSAQGWQVLSLRSGSSTVVAKLPAGLENYELRVVAHTRAELQIKDAAHNSSILSNGRLSQWFAAPYGNFHYRHTAPGTDTLLISGRLPMEVLLVLANLVDEQGTATLHYRFDGVRPCPTVPLGCRAFNMSAAASEVRAFSDWARFRYADVDLAWEALFEVAAGAAAGGFLPGRRLRAQTEISRSGWKSVCDFWGGASSSSTWQHIFHLLDEDRSNAISKAEFGGAYGRPPSCASASCLLSLWIVLVPVLAALVVFGLRVQPAVLAMVTSRPSKLDRETCAEHFDEAKVTFTAAKCKDPYVYAASDLETANFMRRTDDARRSKGSRTLEMSAAGAEAPGSLGLPSRLPLAGSAGAESCASAAETAPSGLRPPDDQPEPAESSGLELEPSVDDGRSGAWCTMMSCIFGRSSEGEGMQHPLLPPRGGADELEAIVQQMCEDEGDLDLQEASLDRLEDLVLEPELMPRVRGCGALGAVVGAMSAHPTSPAVQESGCAMLGNCASHSPGWQQEELIRLNAVPAVVKAMHSHHSNPWAQEAACWALREFATFRQGRDHILEQEGIERVLRALQDHALTAAILEHGCLALAYLAHEPKHRKVIAREGGITTVLTSMRNVPHVGAVQEAGCLALRNLSCSTEHKATVLELHGDDDILQAMRTHPPLASLQETALDALLVLSLKPERLVDGGAVKLIVRAMECHADVEDLQQTACKLLVHVGCGGAKVRAELTRLRASYFARRAKARFTSPGVKAAAGKALEVLPQGGDEGSSE